MDHFHGLRDHENPTDDPWHLRLLYTYIAVRDKFILGGIDLFGSCLWEAVRAIESC